MSTVTTSNRHGMILQPMANQVIHRHLRNFALLPRGDRRCAAAEIVAGPGFHFDEDRGVAVAGNDVDLAKFCAVAAWQ